VKTKPATRRYLRIDDVVYQSEAFRTLPSGALKLWLDMRTQFKGSNNGNISATMSILVHRGWTSTHTLHRVLPVLLERGLIARTRQGKPGPYRICSLYRFTDLPTAKNEAAFIVGSPATYDFEHWTPSTKRKIRASETEATLLPKRERNKFRNGSVESATDSETEAQKNAEIGPKATPVLASSGIGTHDAQHFRNGTSLYIPGDQGSGVAVRVALESGPEIARGVERSENPALANDQRIEKGKGKPCQH
jgi:hypothetical protein